MKSYTGKKLGLALGSGGARGFAHIALLDFLDEKKIKPSFITGSSMGAVMGAAYALTGSSRAVKKMTHHFISHQKKKIDFLIKSVEGKSSLTDQFEIARRTTVNLSVMEENYIYNMLSLIFGKAKFKHTKIPFGAVATDWKTGNCELIDSGYIVDAVCASSSIPGPFHPVRLGSTRFLDGGVVRVVPVIEALQMGADEVIGSDVSFPERKSNFKNTMDLIGYINSIKTERLLYSDLKDARYKIYFHEMEMPWYRFDLFNEIIRNSKQILNNIFEKELNRISLTYCI